MARKHMDIDRLALPGHSHSGGWIVSYADMMTIILTFFILLLSISTIAQTKYELLVQAFTGERAGNLTEVKEEIDKIIEEQQLGGEISTMMDKDGLVIEFSNALLFNSGEASLKEGAETALAPIERHLVNELDDTYGLVIEGYTDDVPINKGRFRSNWDLSASRAIHVMERLHQAGLDPRRISIKGYADTRPATEVDISKPDQLAKLSPESLEEVRAANRRVIIRIDALPPELLLRLGLESKKKKKLPDAAAPTEKKLEDVDNLGPFELPDVKSEEQPDAPKQ